jgi:hypothetical protein
MAANPTLKLPMTIGGDKALADNTRTMRRLRAYCSCVRLGAETAAKNSIQVTVDEVLATVGGSQGLYGAFQIVLDPVTTH